MFARTMPWTNSRIAEAIQRMAGDEAGMRWDFWAKIRRFAARLPFAEDLLFSGRSVGAEEALRLGLASSVSADAEAAALAYFDQHLAGKSASSLACAVAAARGGYLQRVRRRIADVERLYLERLMQTRDANEGLAAFIAKRAPKWEHK